MFSTSVQGSDLVKLLALGHLSPVGLELGSTGGCPFLDQAECRSRLHRASQHLAVERERSLLSLVFSMKVGHSMFTIEHSNHDAEKSGDDGHEGIVRPWLLSA